MEPLAAPISSISVCIIVRNSFYKVEEEHSVLLDCTERIHFKEKRPDVLGSSMALNFSQYTETVHQLGGLGL